MNHPKTLTVHIRENEGQREVLVEPDELEVDPGDVVQVDVAAKIPYLGVEVHVPGNKARGLMFNGRPETFRRADVIYRKNGKISFRVGSHAVTGKHPLRIYAHFSGSVVTAEGRTSTGLPPSMIVK